MHFIAEIYMSDLLLHTIILSLSLSLSLNKLYILYIVNVYYVSLNYSNYRFTL